MQPVFKRTVLSSAIALACYGGAAHAACPGKVTATEGACALPGGGSVIVTETGLLPSLNVAAPGTGNVTVAAGGRIASVKATSAVVNYAGNLGGTLDNSGLIRNRQTTGSAYGIYIEDSLSGTLTNSGAVRAISSGTSATAIAIWIEDDDLSGTLTNTGTISAMADASSWNYAYGLYVNGSTTGDVTGTLDNQGVIDVKATGGTWASAYGIYVEGDIGAAGSVTNSGTINVVAEGTTGVSAYGIYIDDDLNGTLTNSGSVRVLGSNPTSGAGVMAIGVDGDLNGTLTNSGTVEAILEGSTWGTAYGVYVGGDVAAGAALTNTGTISARGNLRGDGGDSVYGISIGGDLDGDLLNTGTVEAKHHAVDRTSSGPAYGIYVDGEIGTTGSLVNSGLIDAASTSDGGGDSVYGIVIDSDIRGTLDNIGTAQALASGTTWSTAFGVYVGGDIEAGGVLTNSGLIAAEVAAGSGGTAYGIYIDGSTLGDLDNSGIVTALVDVRETGGTAYGIYVDGNVAGTSLRNSGTVKATVVAANPAGGTWASAGPMGIGVSGDLTGLLENSGTVSATGTVNGTAGYNVSSVYGYGIYIGGDVTAGAHLKNSGSVSVSVNNSGALGTTNPSAGLQAYGIYVDGDFAGRFVNSGTIEASKSGAAFPTASFAFAFGVGGDSTGGVFTNSGTIIGDVLLNGGTLNLNGGSITGAITSVNALNINVRNVFMSSEYDIAGATIGNFFVQDRGDWIMDTALPDVAVLSVLSGGRLTFALNGLNVVEDLNGAGTLALRPNVNATLTGNYTQNAGGTYEVGVKSATAFGKLTVTGTADLSASNRVAVAVTGLVAKDSTQNDVLTATTLTTGGALTTTDDNLFYDFTAIVDGNTIDLTSQRALTVAGIASDAGLGYAAGAAATLDELFDLGGTGSSFDNQLLAIAGLSTQEEVVNAISQLVPAVIGRSGEILNQNANQLAGVIDDRLGDDRGANAGSHMFNEGNLWVRPLGAYADHRARDGVPGFDLHSMGIAFGGDYEPSDRLRLGAGFAWSDTEIEGRTVSRNELNVETYQLVLYGSYALNARDFVDGYAIVGWNDHDSFRDINIGAIDATAAADYDSIFTRLYLGVGREYRMSDRFSFSPLASLRYTYIDEDSYTESGAGGFNLSVSSNDEDALILGLDGVANYALSPKGIWRLKLRGGVGYDVLTVNTVVTSAFTGGGSAFSTQGSEPDEFVYRGGVSIGAEPRELMNVSISYDFVGREDFESHAFYANLRWRF